MIELIEDLKDFKQVYILNTNVWRKEKIEYAMYSVLVLKNIGVNVWFAKLATSAFKSNFPKKINVKGLGLQAKRQLEVFGTKAEMVRYYCHILRDAPDKNQELFEKMLKLHPQNFI